MDKQGKPQASDLKRAAALIVAAVLVLFLIRQTGYPILSRHDERVGAYVLDVVQNGNWIIQKDSTGEIAAKPPLLTWCAALVTLVTGRITQFAIHLPAAVSLCGTALILLVAGSEWSGWRAGFFAACASVVSSAGATQFATARYDGLLALTVILAALAAFRAWIGGSGWTWFWLAAAFGTMAKGPLAVLLGAAGLLAAVWEWRSRSPVPFRGNHLAGILIFLMICGGWFALAYHVLGQPLIDKMIGRELVGQAVGTEDPTAPLGPLKPPIDFMLGFAPWSLVTLVAFWRVWKRPDLNPLNRRFERFLTCGFLAGLVAFCLGGHQKGRLILPLIPFVALLAGRELSDFTVRWSNRNIFRAAIVVVALFALGVFVHAHLILRSSSRVRETLAARQAAGLIRERLGSDAVLTYVDCPFEVQFYLNILRPTVPFDRAAALLSGKDAAWVAVSDFAGLEKALGDGAAQLHEALRWPEAGKASVRVVGNQPWAVTNQPVAMLLGPLRLEMQHLRPERLRINHQRGAQLTFRGDVDQGTLQIENQSEAPQKVSLHVLDAATATDPIVLNLQPGATWASMQIPQFRK